MKELLCICQNRQSVNNLLPIIKIVKSKGDINIDFLNIDSFLHQNVTSLISGEKLIDLDMSLEKPFFQMNSIERLKVVLLDIPKVKFKKKYDLLLLGGIGVLEYYIAKQIKKSYKTKIVLVQDAILLYPEKYINKKKLRKFIYGFKTRQNICDKIFVSGEATQKTLLADGVKKRKIIVSGIPRFEKLFDNYSTLLIQNNSKFKILFLTGGFKWHGQNKLEQEEQNVLLDLNDFAKENSDILSISLKTHPRTYTTENYSDLKYLQIIPKENEDLYRLIKQYDLIICGQQISTLIFESFWLDKKCVYISPSKIYKMAVEKKFINDVKIVNRIVDLKLIIKNLQNDVIDTKLLSQNRNFYISSNSKTSKILIAKEIYNLLSKNNNSYIETKHE